ncbi:MAG: hypothetical protein A2900_02605 [Candidatus Chisholmbacteria bacterium RIFCSPLOWO2_01_FULL_50_28]|uniref:Uncharacterized protein n=1 Tax=Candidatus Chisholmbacteria bacterium RIFCSPHIGHO2_01_FULL_52_32 TaxID=1797591 RepID=A0A1G1VTC2_9BACT|nr:MAG: hypothetical protein A2786_04140 [Candidatus Chisholmbacteria bacterium RIFCSPHIGHO2_01_FULL_52_32]OGY19969.1 MAG: hypothetical protein A2900_02605 [Candidatus Chisholmbacteria bacterium RIFCSPLOWO2_01_FULL_50_28]
MRKFTVAFFVLVTSVFPPSAMAQEITQTCTPFYGGGVVCGAHTPVDTGFVSSAFFQIAAVAFVTGLSLFAIARRLKSVYLLE